jgi:hypothetical protein
LWREAHGVVAVGPSGPAATKPTPTLAAMKTIDREAVHLELKAVDQRLRDIADLFGRTRPGVISYEDQELNVEYKQLFDIRRDIRDDIESDRDGRPLDVRQRLIRRERAATIRATCWEQAEAARREGDHRRARRHRLDALRARHLAESELGWRNLTTYW